MRWRVTHEGRFYDSGEESIVYYDTSSGDTHLLSELALQIIQTLTGNDLNTRELAAKLNESYQPENPQELVSVLADALEELASLRIIDQI